MLKEELTSGRSVMQRRHTYFVKNARRIRLYQEKEKYLRKRRSLDQNKLVINLSRKTLSENQNKVLALGLNFATAPKEIPKKDIIARTESFAIYMKEDGQLLREGIKKCLEDAKPTKCTLNREERSH